MLAKLEMEPPFQRFAALICAFSLCSLVTELPAWTTRHHLLTRPTSNEVDDVDNFNIKSSIIDNAISGGNCAGHCRGYG